MADRVLITGGLGVNGAWVTRGLIKSGFYVTVADNRDDTSLLGAEQAKSVRLVQCDICDQADVARLFAEEVYTCVVHMAAAVGHSDIDSAPGQTFRSNAQATVDLLEAASRANAKRFILASLRAETAQPRL